MACHRVRAVALCLWRCGIGALFFKETFLLYLLKTLLMFLVLVCDILDGFSPGTVIL